MRVALNMLHLVPRETGGSELYARRLVPALLEERPGIRLTVLAAREGAPSLRAEPWARDVEVVELPVTARSRSRRVLAEQTLLPLAVRSARPDLLHNLFSTAPAVASVPSVTTIHDVIYRRFPEAHEGVLSRGMALLTWVAAHRSRRIITQSYAAKEDIVRFLHIPADRVDVAHLGPGLRDDVEPTPEPALRRQLGLRDREIVLTVSAKRAHKNLERLLDAFAAVSSRRRAVLVVPGYATRYEQRLREHAPRGAVVFAGWLDDATLDGLYRAAACFVFPSLAEGFGLPVLEAMLRGAPVASSNATSLPEVAGDAAVYFDPTDTAGMAHAIERILSDPALRDRLAELGREQARTFSWKETARRTVASYDRALAAARS